MNPAVPASGTTIRARIHDSAIKRVTRFFSSSLADIFTETFQNARRAGARHVFIHVAADRQPCTITIIDDGDGIADPAVLLSFGENGWSPDLVRSEDAADMGFIALARRGCTVSSRPRSANGTPYPGWAVSLAPEHFTGDADATVNRDDHAPWPHGTTVSFTIDESHNTIRNAATAAARYFPLTVHLSGLPESPEDGEELERRPFLAGALHTERWQGIAFGVFRNMRHRHGDPDTNFHGVTVSAALPEITAANDDNWSVLADIQDCPKLELVLPARREVVQTPFLDELRQAARLCVYRAMARQPHPDPIFADWQCARSAGIRIPPARPRLRPWKPSIADQNAGRGLPKRQDTPSSSLLMDFHPEPPEAQALYRALGHSDMAHQVFETNHLLEGYGWYDSLYRIAAAPAEVLHQGSSIPIIETGATSSEDATPDMPDRPEDILVKLCIQHRERADKSFTMAADLAFPSEPYASLDEVQPVVSLNSELQPHELAQLIYAAYFSPSDDWEADSWETQSEQFMQEATTLSTTLLCGRDEAVRQALTDLANRELRWLVPANATAIVTIRDRQVTVSLDTGEEAA
ncbi:MAG: hypothetical protein OXN81_02005 [Alphaproteobacteria bacterium]|nr:hypothetical protein [Alphaproteobacteria bacterium]